MRCRRPARRQGSRCGLLLSLEPCIRTAGISWCGHEPLSRVARWMLGTAGPGDACRMSIGSNVLGCVLTP